MEPKTADELQQLLTKSEAENDELKKQLEDAYTANEALSSEIEKLSKTSEVKQKEAGINLHEHSFEHNGKKYGFNYPKLTLDKQVVTPVEVKASAELQKRLVDSDHSMIKEL